MIVSKGGKKSWYRSKRLVIDSEEIEFLRKEIVRLLSYADPKYISLSLSLSLSRDLIIYRAYS